jgi:hypothetical protein
MSENHDQNVKNVFLDFPKEALEWLFPLQGVDVRD